MKLKYFLRGLGMGIVFSAVLLMAVGATKKEVLTDEEIMARASLLGMIRPDEVQQPTQTPAVTDTPAPKETPTNTETPDVPESPAATENPSESENPESTEAPAVTPGASEAENPTEPETPSQEDNSEYVTITIEEGTPSRVVAKALEAAGVVSSAKELDTYLCDNGYSFSISVGTFKIRVGADYNEIAEQITK